MEKNIIRIYVENLKQEYILEILNKIRNQIRFLNVLGQSYSVFILREAASSFLSGRATKREGGRGG